MPSDSREGKRQGHSTQPAAARWHLPRPAHHLPATLAPPPARVTFQNTLFAGPPPRVSRSFPLEKYPDSRPGLTARVASLSFSPWDTRHLLCLRGLASSVPCGECSSRLLPTWLVLLRGVSSMLPPQAAYQGLSLLPPPPSMCPPCRCLSKHAFLLSNGAQSEATLPPTAGTSVKVWRHPGLSQPGRGLPVGRGQERG